MSIKQLVARQYRENVNSTANQASSISIPDEGWIRTVRKALSMSGTQLAKRLNVSKGLISNTEKAELSGGVTLRNMQNMAEAMNCRFIYAIVPESSVEDIIHYQAVKKASAQVKEASIQMALEDQALSKTQLQAEIDRISKELQDNPTSDLWNEE